MTETPLWTAPTASAPIDAVVTVPGSKSLTNRALVLGALSTSPVLLRRPLRARDTLLMADGLRAMGIGVSDEPDGSWQITPARPQGPATVDCGLAGTVMRFLPPLAAVGTGDVHFDGDIPARTRPMGPLLTALRALGATVDDGGRALLPFTISGRGWLPGGEVALDASASSQFVSALLLAAPRFADGLIVRHIGPPLPSLPHVLMTLTMLDHAGVDASNSQTNEWRVAPGPVDLGTFSIEPDLSSAAPFLAAALVTGGRVRMRHWPERSTQPGILLPLLLERMGATTSYEDGVLTVVGHGRITGFDMDLRDVGELVPVLAALAALAQTPSNLRGIAHLRGHETDRLTALRYEINALGGDVEEFSDGLEIRPKPLHGGVFSTHDDHRMAMAAAVLGLAVPGVQVVDIDTTRKTLPDFPSRWHGLLDGTSGDQT